jgi:chromosome partitioning protein
MLTVLVINSKGGSGKTTLSTNLAAYYASLKVRTAVLDYDPQGSITHWLKLRPESADRIHGGSAMPSKGLSVLCSRQTWVPPDTEILIIDAPAGAKGVLLQDLVRRSTHIVIPVAPSPIDIHATADFIKDLYCSGGARRAGAKIAVVASRVRNPASEIYAGLERFLRALKLPFLTTIRDTESYLHAVGKGLGIFEMPETSNERRDLTPIFEWLNLPIEHRFAPQPAESAVEVAPAPAVQPVPITARKSGGISLFRRFQTQRPASEQDAIPQSLRAKSGELIR